MAMLNNQRVTIRNDVSGDCETSVKIYAHLLGEFEDPLKSYSYFDVNARHRVLTHSHG